MSLTYKQYKNTEWDINRIQGVIDKWGKGKSPLTAQDYYTVANTVGVDAGLLLSMGIAESQLGLTGRGARTRNVGNVGNDDAGNNREFPTWRDGLTAQAILMRDHYGANMTDNSHLFKNGFKRTDGKGYYAGNNKGYAAGIAKVMKSVTGSDFSNYLQSSNQNTQSSTPKFSNLYGVTSKFEGWKYGFGANDSKNKRIDCSNFVTCSLGIPYQTSEGLYVSSLKNNSAQNVTKGSYGHLKEGDLVFMDTGVRGFDKGRKHGIDHVGLVVKNPNTGKMELHESVGGTGFKRTNLDEALNYYTGKGKVYSGNLGGNFTPNSSETDTNLMNGQMPQLDNLYSIIGDLSSQVHAQQQDLMKRQEENAKLQEAEARRQALLEKQQERDFLVAQTMAAKVQYIER